MGKNVALSVYLITEHIKYKQILKKIKLKKKKKFLQYVYFHISCHDSMYENTKHNIYNIFI